MALTKNERLVGYALRKGWIDEGTAMGLLDDPFFMDPDRALEMAQLKQLPSSKKEEEFTSEELARAAKDEPLAEADWDEMRKAVQAHDAELAREKAQQQKVVKQIPQQPTVQQGQSTQESVQKEQSHKIEQTASMPKNSAPKRQQQVVQQPIATNAQQLAAAQTFGFNPGAFVRNQQTPGIMGASMVNPARVQMDVQQQPVVQQNNQQQSQQNLIPAPVYPEGFNNLAPSDRCRIVEAFINQPNSPYPQIFDNTRNLQPKQKLEELMKMVDFIPGNHPGGFHPFELIGMMYLVKTTLRQKMASYGALDNPSFPHLREVGITEFGGDDTAYTIAFSLRMKDRSKLLIAYLNTVPSFNVATGSWTYAMGFDVVNKPRRQPQSVAEDKKQEETQQPETVPVVQTEEKQPELLPLVQVDQQ